MFKDFLETLPPDQLVKLGAKKGSQFVVIDTAQNIKNNLDVVNDVFLDIVKKTAATSKKNLNIALQKWPTPADYMRDHHKTHLKGKMNPTIDGYDTMLKLWFKSVTRAFVRSDAWDDHLENYIHIGEREVVDSYDAIDLDEPSLIVLLEGYEVGNLWMPSEVINGVDEEDENE